MRIILYSELVDSVLQLLDEYSRKGTPLAATKTVDYKLKMPAAINSVLMNLADTSGRIPAEWTIINNPIYNEHTRDTSEIQTHIPGTDDTPTTLTGALSYFIEASGYYDIYIEEEIASVWTTLTRLQPTPGSEPTSFTELKGVLTPSDTANDVRIRCTGDYPYPYRNYILYPYNFPTATLVQQHRPYFTATLPTDWLKFKSAILRSTGSDWIYLQDYKITPTQFGYSRYLTGEILVSYYRKPTAIVVADPASPTVSELAQEIDAVTQAVHLVPLGVAGTILAGDDANASSYFLQLFNNGKYELSATETTGGISTILSTNGW